MSLAGAYITIKDTSQTVAEEFLFPADTLLPPSSHSAPTLSSVPLAALQQCMERAGHCRLNIEQGFVCCVDAVKCSLCRCPISGQHYPTISCATCLLQLQSIHLFVTTNKFKHHCAATVGHVRQYGNLHALQSSCPSACIPNKTTIAGHRGH